MKHNGCFLLLLTGLVPRSFNHRDNSALSEALSAIRRFDALPMAMSRSATGQSCASPPSGGWREDGPEHLRVHGPLCCARLSSGQSPASAPPFSTRCRAVRFDVRGVDHLRVCRSPVSSKFPEQIFPDPAPRPAHEAVIDRRRRTMGRRAIAPATAVFQHLHDAADDAAVIHPLNPADIRRQEWFDPLPLLVAQPKQIPAHNFKSFPPKNHYLIVSEEGLMSSDPRK